MRSIIAVLVVVLLGGCSLGGPECGDWHRNPENRIDMPGACPSGSR